MRGDDSDGIGDYLYPRVAGAGKGNNPSTISILTTVVTIEGRTQCYRHEACDTCSYSDHLESASVANVVSHVSTISFQTKL